MLWSPLLLCTTNAYSTNCRAALYLVSCQCFPFSCLANSFEHCPVWAFFLSLFVSFNPIILPVHSSPKWMPDLHRFVIACWSRSSPCFLLVATLSALLLAAPVVLSFSVFVLSFLLVFSSIVQEARKKKEGRRRTKRNKRKIKEKRGEETR